MTKYDVRTKWSKKWLKNQQNHNPGVHTNYECFFFRTNILSGILFTFDEIFLLENIQVRMHKKVLRQKCNENKTYLVNRQNLNNQHSNSK